MTHLNDLFNNVSNSNPTQLVARKYPKVSGKKMSPSCHWAGADFHFNNHSGNVVSKEAVAKLDVKIAPKITKITVSVKKYLIISTIDV